MVVKPCAIVVFCTDNRNEATINEDKSAIIFGKGSGMF